MTRPHLLVVDDDRRLRELLSRYLSGNGFVVTTAADVAEAIAARAQFVFDLIVMDIMMPGQSGLDATRLWRGDPEDAVPILLLTARDAPEDRIQGLEAGADDYLPKPFEPRELLLRITAILKRAASRPAPAEPASGTAAGFESLALGRWQFHPARLSLSDAEGQSQSLTASETALLLALAASLHESVSREEIVERARLNGGARSVDVLVTRLRRKIEEDPRNPRVLVTVRGGGYALRAGPQPPAEKSSHAGG